LILRRARIVLAAVDLDDQPRLQTTAIDDIIADLYLFAKLAAA
jgi:hypothetical protein